MALEEAQPFIWGSGGSRLTPEQIDAQRKVARAMMEKGMDYSPIQSWTQGGARVSQALLGAMESREADAAAKTNAAADREMIASLISGGTPTASAGPPAVAPPVSASPSAVQIVPADQFNSIDAMADLKPQTQGRLPAAQNAVAGVESGGRYDATGPMISSGPMAGQRAIGKYQVMEGNVAPWTKQVMGQPMTPQQFAASPDAQDAVFNGKFGGYMDKYGTAGATRAWHAGEGGMNNPLAQDQLGTKTSTYGQNIAALVDGDGAVLPPSAKPAGPATATTPVQAVASSQAGPTPAVQTVAGPLAGVNPALVQALASPYASEGVKKIAGIILQNQLTAQGVTTVDLGNAVGIMDKHGNMIKSIPKGEPNKGPTHGVIGKNEFGVEQYGWTDPRSQSTRPDNPVSTPAAPSIIPPAPSGVDPKVWREQFSKNAVGNALPAPFDDTAKVRHEVTQLPSYKNLAAAAPIYKAMVETGDTDSKASDLNLVYGLGKIMDPTSVVREGEMIMVKNTASLPDWLVGAANGLNGGAALTPETRAAILREAHNRINSYKTMFDQDSGMYRGIAERGRMNVQDVLPDFGEFKPYERKKKDPPPSGKTSSGVPWSVN